MNVIFNLQFQVNRQLTTEVLTFHLLLKAFRTYFPINSYYILELGANFSYPFDSIS